MDTNSKKRNDNRRAVYYAGAGLAIGAGVGMVLGPLLVENLAWGCVIGSALGLLIGAAIDALGSRETDTNDKEDA